MQVEDVEHDSKNVSKTRQSLERMNSIASQLQRLEATSKRQRSSTTTASTKQLMTKLEELQERLQQSRELRQSKSRSIHRQSFSVRSTASTMATSCPSPISFLSESSSSFLATTSITPEQPPRQHKPLPPLSIDIAQIEECSEDDENDAEKIQNINSPPTTTSPLSFQSNTAFTKPTPQKPQNNGHSIISSPQQQQEQQIETKKLEPMKKRNLQFLPIREHPPEKDSDHYGDPEEEDVEESPPTSTIIEDDEPMDPPIIVQPQNETSDIRDENETSLEENDGIVHAEILESPKPMEITAIEKDGKLSNTLASNMPHVQPEPRDVQDDHHLLPPVLDASPPILDETIVAAAEETEVDEPLEEDVETAASNVSISKIGQETKEYLHSLAAAWGSAIQQQPTVQAQEEAAIQQQPTRANESSSEMVQEEEEEETASVIAESNLVATTEKQVNGEEEGNPTKEKVMDAMMGEADHGAVKQQQQVEEEDDDEEELVSLGSLIHQPTTTSGATVENTTTSATSDVSSAVEATISKLQEGANEYLNSLFGSSTMQQQQQQPQDVETPVQSNKRSSKQEAHNLAAEALGYGIHHRAATISTTMQDDQDSSNPADTPTQRVSKLKQEAHEYLSRLATAALDEEDGLISDDAATSSGEAIMEDLHSLSSVDDDNKDPPGIQGNRNDQYYTFQVQPNAALAIPSAAASPIAVASTTTTTTEVHQEQLQESSDLELGIMVPSPAGLRKSVSFGGEQSNTVHLIEPRMTFARRVGSTLDKVLPSKCSRNYTLLILAVLFLGGGAGATILAIRAMTEK